MELGCECWRRSPLSLSSLVVAQPPLSACPCCSVAPQLLFDVFSLPLTTFDGPAYLHPPSSYDHESPLQRPLYRLLKSRNQRTTLRQSDLCGYGVLLRVMPQNKPAGAADEQLAQLTDAGEGEAVAGCSLRLLLEVKLNGAVKGAHPTRHHALHVQFASTKKGREDRGYMRLLMLGQVRLMAGQQDRSDNQLQSRRPAAQPHSQHCHCSPHACLSALSWLCC